MQESERQFEDLQGLRCVDSGCERKLYQLGCRNWRAWLKCGFAGGLFTRRARMRCLATAGWGISPTPSALPGVQSGTDSLEILDAAPKSKTNTFIFL